MTAAGGTSPCQPDQSQRPSIQVGSRGGGWTGISNRLQGRAHVDDGNVTGSEGFATRLKEVVDLIRSGESTGTCIVSKRSSSTNLNSPPPTTTTLYFPVEDDEVAYLARF